MICRVEVSSGSCTDVRRDREDCDEDDASITFEGKGHVRDTLGVRMFFTSGVDVDAVVACLCRRGQRSVLLTGKCQRSCEHPRGSIGSFMRLNSYYIIS
jgi:hypothetical protein